jgi:hypothetical protein
MHTKTWHVEILIFEHADETAAHAVLHTEAPEHVKAAGAARRRPGDPDAPEVGDEVAAARALIALGTSLLGIAANDIEGLEGDPEGSVKIDMGGPAGVHYHG